MIKGALKKWDDDKGYGFIKQEGEGPDVFIHISALRGLGRRPKVGDAILFRIVTDNGKTRAADATIEGLPPPDENPGTWWTLEPVEHKPARIHERPVHPPRSTSQPIVHERRRGKFGDWVLLIGLLAAILGYGKRHYEEDVNERATASMPSEVLPAAEAPPTPAFKCEGKTYCSQMASCAEAMFYLRNCPDTKMDGDLDGIPCEDQYCGH